MGDVSKDKEQLMLGSTFGMTKYTSDFSFPSQYCLASYLSCRHTTEVLYQFVPCQYHFNASIWLCLAYRHVAQAITYIYLFIASCPGHHPDENMCELPKLFWFGTSHSPVVQKCVLKNWQFLFLLLKTSL